MLDTHLGITVYARAKHLLFTSSLLIVMATVGHSSDNPVVFQGQTNLGRMQLAGSFQFDSLRGCYRITGSGENMWGAEDAFFYTWRRIRGDVALKARVNWEGAGKHPHRKGGWMLRESLEADAPYVDAVLHGDGLISMQYRVMRGGITQEVQSPFKGNATLVLERSGDQFTMTAEADDGEVHPVGTITVSLPKELYAGLAVCSHDSTTQETALFSAVHFREIGAFEEKDRKLESTLERMDVFSGMRTVIRRFQHHIEAPNWSRDGSMLLWNSRGRLYSMPISGADPTEVHTAFATRCNNDHGFSPDGKELAISHHEADGKSYIYILPSAGGTPKKVTAQGPSYWHGWSPDGTLLVYCAERNGAFDVYSIPTTGGQETQLTRAPGLDDGPDFSPDGKCIYFNSSRTGHMKIWRMNADGSDQKQVTPDDDYGDWFPHPSPDGKWIVFLSYDKSVEGHPPNKDVVLRVMPAEGGEPRILAQLFGGQGTMNVPSWSPDSKQFAFVSYRLIAP